MLRGLVAVALFIGGLSTASFATSGEFSLLFVSKSHSPAIGTVGQPLTYSVGVSNQGLTNETIQDVSVTDTLPDEVTFSSASAGCTYEGLVICDAGTLAPGGSDAFTIVVTPTVSGTITNTARASGDTCGECPVFSNTATDVATVVGGEQPSPPPPPPPPPPAPPADVTVVVELSPVDPVAGEVLTIRITATNKGPNDASDVSVLSEAPEGVTEASGTSSKGSCEGTANLVCTIGTLSAVPPGARLSQRRSLAVGESAQVVHRVLIPAAGPATSRITVQTSSSDPNPTDNRRVVDFPVLVTRTAGGQPPPPPPPPPPTDDDGEPNANETVVVQELSGRVRARLPGTNRFVELTALSLRELPNGTLVDATGGRFRLVTAASGGQSDLSEFFQGTSTISQLAPAAARATAQASEPGVTELRLAGGDFGKPCTTALAKARPKKKTKKAKRTTFGVAQAKPVKPVRRLWGDGSGKFRTRGRYASATVRGTVWLTEDYCNGSLVRVRVGAVTVRDLVRNRTVIVRAGQSYFAESRAAARARRG